MSTIISTEVTKEMGDSYSRRKNQEIRGPRRSTLGDYLYFGRKREGSEKERQRCRDSTLTGAITGPGEECSMEVERPMVKLRRCS